MAKEVSEVKCKLTNIFQKEWWILSGPNYTGCKLIIWKRWCCISKKQKLRGLLICFKTQKLRRVAIIKPALIAPKRSQSSKKNKSRILFFWFFFASYRKRRKKDPSLSCNLETFRLLRVFSNFQILGSTDTGTLHQPSYYCRHSKLCFIPFCVDYGYWFSSFIHLYTFWIRNQKTLFVFSMVLMFHRSLCF